MGDEKWEGHRSTLSALLTDRWCEGTQRVGGDMPTGKQGAGTANMLMQCGWGLLTALLDPGHEAHQG